MIKILCIASDKKDTTSFYRMMGPLSEISLRRPDVHITYTDDVCWGDIKAHHIIYMQRPYEPAFKIIAEMTKDFNRKLWIDYDDALDHVPVSNSSYSYYNDPRCMHKIMELADKITVSTKGLKNLYKAHEHKVSIIPNALDDVFIPLHKKTDREKVITWRGSNTHEMDVLSEIRAISGLFDNHKSHKFYFVGCVPSCIEILNKSNVYFVSKLNIEKYMQKLCGLIPDTHIVPLAKSTFNNCKSNISWIEGTVAGARVLASELEEFDRPGIGTFQNPDKASNKLSWEYIRDCLLLSKINNLREHIIEQLYTPNNNH